MSKDTLTAKDVKRLVALGKRIRASLDCDANGSGLPCRTDRLDAVENMREYLKIHGIETKERTA